MLKEFHRYSISLGSKSPNLRTLIETNGCILTEVHEMVDRIPDQGEAIKYCTLIYYTPDHVSQTIHVTESLDEIKAIFSPKPKGIPSHGTGDTKAA